MRQGMNPLTHHALTRRQALATLAAGIAGPNCVAAYAADAWPTKPVRIIIPFAPGGASDSSARALGEILAPQLGQPVVIENKPGAGGVIGVTAAAQSRDGHTLLMGSTSMTIAPSLYASVGYDLQRDFDAIGMVSAQPLVLVVPASSNILSVKDLIAAAKAKPDTLSAGNSGSGSLAHLTAELFAIQTSITIVSVPYKGESALLPDMISGLVSLGFLNLPSVLPHIKSGRLRALAVSTAQPIPELPEVPTLASQGVPGLEVQGWAALLAAKGIPPEGLARLETLLMAALKSDVIKKRFADVAVTPIISTRAGLQDYLKAESARWSRVIKARGIKVEGS